jgi:acyl-coenzyme A synthetase/AMP-(fatty) acid ligase
MGRALLESRARALGIVERADQCDVEPCRRRSPRLLGTVGEPINPEAWICVTLAAA